MCVSVLLAEQGRIVKAVRVECFSVSYTQNFIFLFILCKEPSKVAAATHLFFHCYLLKTIRLDVSCESSPQQRIHMKYRRAT